MLECYRVILLLRPPNSSFRSDFRIRSHSDPAFLTLDADKLVTTLFTPGSSIDHTSRHQDSIIALSTISIMAWPVLPRGVIRPGKRTLWRVEFIELALNSWAKTQNDSTTWSTLLLYHLIHINLHTNVDVVQRFAHSPAGSPFRSESGKAYACIEQWRKSRHFSIAKWHARSILRRVKDATVAIQKRPSDTLGDLPSETGRHLILPEAPHLPYCIYFAALVLWCGSVVSADEKTSSVSSIETSSQLLSVMKVRVAELLGGILRELRT